jgi:hypothetical protein
LGEIAVAFYGVSGPNFPVRRAGRGPDDSPALNVRSNSLPTFGKRDVPSGARLATYVQI